MAAIYSAYMALYIPITDKLRQRLIAERQRTGIGPTVLMRGSVHDADRPYTLKGQTISLWLSGKIVNARRSQLDYVFARWAALPDARDQNARQPQERTILSEEHLRLIGIYWDKGLLPDKILKNNDAPNGLNAAIIRTWKDRRIKSAATAYLDFVLHACAEAAQE